MCACLHNSVPRKNKLVFFISKNCFPAHFHNWVDLLLAYQFHCGEKCFISTSVSLFRPMPLPVWTLFRTDSPRTWQCPTIKTQRPKWNSFSACRVDKKKSTFQNCFSLSFFLPTLAFGFVFTSFPRVSFPLSVSWISTVLFWFFPRRGFAFLRFLKFVGSFQIYLFWLICFNLFSFDNLKSIISFSLSLVSIVMLISVITVLIHVWQSATAVGGVQFD